jgi:hypothetical protein
VADNVVTSPWVHVKGANSNTRQMIHQAKIMMPRDLVGQIGVAYIIGMPTRSGQRPSRIWRGTDPHRSFSTDMSARVVFTIRKAGQMELF